MKRPPHIGKHPVFWICCILVWGQDLHAIGAHQIYRALMYATFGYVMLLLAWHIIHFIKQLIEELKDIP